MNSPILTQQRENFLQVTLNRPEVFNALNRDMMKMLAETLGVAATDTSIQGIVITGTGKAFCSGGDLKAISQQGEDWGTVLHQLAPLFHLAVTEIWRMGKPVVAAINGVAAGGGLSLALACDFRLIGQSASLRQAYTSSGLSMDGGGTFVLPRLIGLARALEIMAFDDPIPAAKALGMGTRHKVRSRSGRPAGILRATGAAGQKLAAFLCLVEKIDGGFVQQHPGNATGAGEAGH